MLLCSISRVMGRLVVLTALLSLTMIQDGFAAAEAEPDEQNAPSAAIYDPDPNHLWNRLFAVFYRQKIAAKSFVWSTNMVGEPRWIGPDVLDPPLGYHPKFLLADEPFARCNALLDEFKSKHGATLIHDPLKRALLQRDLWAVFDVLAQAGQTPMFPPRFHFEFINPSPLPAAQEQHRAILERQLAQVIHSLALSRRQIETLPDTYSEAIKSGAFSDVLETNQYNFLPHDLYVTNSAWHEVLPGHSFFFSDEPPQVSEILEHTLVAGGRSVFRTFVKLPEGAAETSMLATFASENRRYMEETDQNFAASQQFWATNTIAHSNVMALLRSGSGDFHQFSKTNRESADNLYPEPGSHPPRFPPKTQFLLLREMICLDEKGEMVLSHVVESVQCRRLYIDSQGVKRSMGREVELSRVLLFHGQQGGLRPISGGERRPSFYNSLGHLRVDETGNDYFQPKFPQNCDQCHSGNDLLSPVAALSPPSRSVSIEPIARWKQKNGKLDLLRELMLAPAFDKK